MFTSWLTRKQRYTGNRTRLRVSPPATCFLQLGFSSPKSFTVSPSSTTRWTTSVQAHGHISHPNTRSSGQKGNISVVCSRCLLGGLAAYRGGSDIGGRNLMVGGWCAKDRRILSLALAGPGCCLGILTGAQRRKFSTIFPVLSCWPHPCFRLVAEAIVTDYRSAFPKQGKHPNLTHEARCVK